MTRGARVVRSALFAVALGVSAAAPAASVSLAPAGERPIIQVVLLSGTVTSPQSAVLSPSVGGLIEEMRVDAGDRVAAGDVVVRLDRELASLELERAEADEIQAAAALADARRRLREAEELGADRGIAQTQIESIRTEVTRGEAELRSAGAAARRQAAVVRRHDIRAPFAGVVSERIAEAGEWVNPGAGLVELVATDRLRYDFRVSQTHYAAIDDSTEIQLTLDALPGVPIPGRIQAIVPVKDPGARTFLLRAVSESDDTRGITPGMSARASLRIDTGRVAVVVPRDAVLRFPDGRKTVWVAEPGSDEATVYERRVVTGLEFDGMVEVRDGLESGESVVVRGNEALQNGQVVSLR